MRRIHPPDIRPFWSVCSFETLIAFFSYSSPTSLKVSTYNFILPVCTICAKRCHQDFNKALSLKAKAEYEWTYKMFLLLPSNMSIFTKVVDFTSIWFWLYWKIGFKTHISTDYASNNHEGFRFRCQGLTLISKNEYISKDAFLSNHLIDKIRICNIHRKNCNFSVQAMHTTQRL